MCRHVHQPHHLPGAVARAQRPHRSRVWSERVSPVQWAGPRRARRARTAHSMQPCRTLTSCSSATTTTITSTSTRCKRLQQDHQPLFVTGSAIRAFLRATRARTGARVRLVATVSRVADCTALTPLRNIGRGATLSGSQSHAVGWLRPGNRHVRMFYFAGDSGLLGAVPATCVERCGALDVALLPIGAYAPRWFMQDQHMNPEESVHAHLDLQARAQHRDTLRLLSAHRRRYRRAAT